MTHSILFTQEPICAPPCILASREVGACIDFHGIVREMENGQALRGLNYEAYEPMAARQLERMFAELAVDSPVQAVTFIHRLGWVPVGEASLFIRVQAAHRGQALTFCAQSIDRLKRDVPIWKLTQA